MKEFITVAAVFVVIVVVVLGFVYGLRLLSKAATPITISSPKPGITCASMVTGDGAAISCWKD